MKERVRARNPETKSCMACVPITAAAAALVRFHAKRLDVRNAAYLRAYGLAKLAVHGGTLFDSLFEKARSSNNYAPAPLDVAGAMLLASSEAVRALACAHAAVFLKTLLKATRSLLDDVATDVSATNARAWLAAPDATARIEALVAQVRVARKLLGESAFEKIGARERKIDRVGALYDDVVRGVHALLECPRNTIMVRADMGALSHYATLERVGDDFLARAGFSPSALVYGVRLNADAARRFEAAKRLSVIPGEDEGEVADDAAPIGAEIDGVRAAEHARFDARLVLGAEAALVVHVL